MPTPRQELRSLGVPDAMIDTVKIDGKRLVAMEATKEATQPWDRMNKTEARYAAELEYMEQAGEIVAWRFEPIAWRRPRITRPTSWWSANTLRWSLSRLKAASSGTMRR